MAVRCKSKRALMRFSLQPQIQDGRKAVEKRNNTTTLDIAFDMNHSALSFAGCTLCFIRKFFTQYRIVGFS